MSKTEGEKDKDYQRDERQMERETAGTKENILETKQAEDLNGERRDF